MTNFWNTEAGSGPGSFRWDVQNGRFWNVTATAPGCDTVSLGPLPVAPAQVGLLLKLTCDASAPGIVEPGGALRPPVTQQPGLPTVVRIRPEFTNPWRGYCADVFVTNNTGAPVVWNTSFNVRSTSASSRSGTWRSPRGQSQPGHGRPGRSGQPLEQVLAAGATTHDVGFCTRFA